MRDCNKQRINSEKDPPRKEITHGLEQLFESLSLLQVISIAPSHSSAGSLHAGSCYWIQQSELKLLLHSDISNISLAVDVLLPVARNEFQLHVQLLQSLLRKQLQLL